MRRFIWTLVLATGLSAASIAAPQVTYTTSGSSGNWTLDFFIKNTLGVNNLNIYFFGVKIGAHDLMGSPPGWSLNPGGPTWTFGSEGGSQTVYNNVWSIDPATTAQTDQNGQTLGGFKVLDTATLAPTDIQCFTAAYGFGAFYPGHDYILSPTNPAFEGTAAPSTVPEPCTLTVLTGMCGLAALKRRRLSRNRMS